MISDKSKKIKYTAQTSQFVLTCLMHIKGCRILHGCQFQCAVVVPIDSSDSVFG